MLLGVAARSLDMFEVDEDEDEDTAEDATDEIDAAREKPHCTLKAMPIDETDCRTAAEPSSCSGSIAMIMAALATATACSAVLFTYPAVASELLVHVVSWRSLGKQDEVVAL